MTNADWWARVVKARTEHDDLLAQRVWALSKDGHEAAINLRPVPGIGAEIVLDGGWRVAEDPPVSRARAGRTLRRDCGHEGDVRGEGVGLMKSDQRLQRAELVIFIAVVVLGLIVYIISRL